ncbi:NADH-quinone oxidoreductase subunit D [Aegicerativicinus sediminis]|uniref:NADH-quinone oxidoreductase subunit D n=1 Tax=Aegicerativicinus sediminis TaxID=2893202 RepID=UPI001E4E1CBD|nr:NADH-quinone oxidoreductase subunit D [Aegicerativicinus sediminis]
METAVVNTDFKSQEYFINMGPQHPATHGVLRLLLTIDGEIIKKVDPDLGYIHRSIEKMCERDSYQQIVHLTDRMDYLSANINNEAVCLAVENALELEVTDRIKVIRTIVGELTRISSHCLWWGVMGMDVGALTTYFYGFRDREMINDIFEETCGARLTMNYNVPGGLMFDIHPNFVKRVKEFVAHFKTKIPEYDRLLSNNIIFQKRTKGVGVLTKEDAISFGVSGPVGRASGYSCDVRKYHPYSALDRVTFNEALRIEGDTYARYQVRIQELWESLSIIEQLIDNIPEGDYRVPTNAVIKLPKGEYYQKVETARGELGVYIISTGTKNPYRVKFRSPGFSNLSVLNHIAVGSKIADLVAIMATLDLVIPDIDR